MSRTDIDFSTVCDVAEMKGEEPGETKALKEMLSQAQEFLVNFSWCKQIKEEYFGIGIGGIFGVYLFLIEPTKPEIDDWLWTVVGDIPSAYIVAKTNPNPACALQSYIRETRKWVLAAKTGASIESVIPVNVPPTAGNAADLETRLNFLESRVIPKYRKQLDACSG